MVSVMLYPCILYVDLLVYLFVLWVVCLCELSVETIRNMFWCDCSFVVECYGCV